MSTRNRQELIHDLMVSAQDRSEIHSIIKWVREQNSKTSVSLNKIPINNLQGWSLDKENGKIFHKSGGFFSINGIEVSRNYNTMSTWDQPIIFQPEIGVLGFLVKRINGVLKFLTQAKIEPGNLNYIQLSPTVQATKSNYTQKHGGKKPAFIDYFINNNDALIISDQLQSEQGARFYKKRNRNLVVFTENEIEVPENFIWLTLGQLKRLMSVDNLVNMDSRTVISTIPLYKLSTSLITDIQNNKWLKSLFDRGFVMNNDLIKVYSFINNIKVKLEQRVEFRSLKKMRNWEFTENEIKRNDNKHFKVIGVDVEISNREVLNWNQPMIEPTEEGICVFFCKEINGVLNFLVQGKIECGYLDNIELGPTIQTLIPYKAENNENIPFLKYFSEQKSYKVIYDSYQSEEGGRFYKEQNRNVIVIVDQSFENTCPDLFIWLNLNQLSRLIETGNIVNIQARNLISTLIF